MRQLQLKIKLSVLPHDMIMEIISYLPSYFLFHASMRNLWEGVFGSSSNALETNAGQIEHCDEKKIMLRNCNTFFNEILMERLCKKLYNLDSSTQLSNIQIICIIMDTIFKKFVWNNPFLPVDGTNIGTICKVLGVPIELSNTVFVQKLHLEGYSFTNTTNERRKEQLELIEQTFKQSQWRYHELHFLHEFSCRYGYILLLSEETNETRIWKSSLVATTANSHPPTMEISFNITKDSQYKCVKIRGHIFLKKSNLKLPKSDPHIRSVLLEIFPQFTTKINLDNKRDHGNVVDLDEELMLHFFSFVRDVHGYDKPIEREIMLQRFWFPALHTKETLKCTTSRKHMPSLLGRDAHTRISRAMVHSIAKYEVTCIPHSRKVKLKLIPKTIPIFVTNVCFMALIYGCSKLNDFLANKYLKENMDYVILGYFIKGWLVLTTNLAIVVMAVFGFRAFMEMFHSLYESKEIEL